MSLWHIDGNSLKRISKQKLLDYFPELERVADKVVFGSDRPGMPNNWAQH
jgi:hypothetical protein